VHEGARRGDVKALWLNSPFFDWRLPDWRRIPLHLAAALGRFFPFINDPDYFNPAYTLSLLADWEFDARLKPAKGFPLYYGWLGAISDAHAKVQRGLAIACPVLSMHSDESRYRARTGGTSRAGRAASGPTCACSPSLARRTI